MFDLVSGQFLTNAGTGSFIAGNPSYQIPIKVNNALQQTLYLNNPLCKIGTYADYIDYENQQIVRNVGIKVLDGTEDWSYKSTYFSVPFTGHACETTTPACYCTHYLGVTPDTGASALPDMSIKMGYPREDIADFIYLKDTRFSTASGLKTFLAYQYAKGSPVIIVYLLKTPTTEQLTVPALTMAVGTNNITTDTEVSPSDMYAKGKVSQL